MPNLLKVLFVVLILLNPLLAQQDDCADLIQYRDEELVKQYDALVATYKPDQAVLADIQKWRQELEDDNAWAASNGVQLVQTIKLLCDAFGDFMGAVSPQGKAVALAKKFHGAKRVTKVQEGVYEGVSLSKKQLSLELADDLEYELFKTILAELGQLGSATALVVNFKDNLDQFSDHQALRNELKRQLDAFDKAEAKYQARLAQLSAEAKVLNDYKNYLDAYLQKQCGIANCQWIKSLKYQVSRGTRCGKPSSVEVAVEIKGQHIRTFVSFEKSPGEWSKWQYDGTFGKGIAPGTRRTWYTCAGTGRVKVLGLIPTKERCKLPDPQTF